MPLVGVRPRIRSEVADRLLDAGRRGLTGGALAWFVEAGCPYAAGTWARRVWRQERLRAGAPLRRRNGAVKEYVTMLPLSVSSEE